MPKKTSPKYILARAATTKEGKADILQAVETVGEIADGYHTFNELYRYRMLYNAIAFEGLHFAAGMPVIKSRRHHTGEECFGGEYFIVMAQLPTGQVSNHYPLSDWDLFRVPEVEKAPEYDGHTPNEAADRLEQFLRGQYDSENSQDTKS